MLLHVRSFLYIVQETRLPVLKLPQKVAHMHTCTYSSIRLLGHNHFLVQYNLITPRPIIGDHQSNIPKSLQMVSVSTSVWFLFQHLFGFPGRVCVVPVPWHACQWNYGIRSQLSLLWDQVLSSSSIIITSFHNATRSG